MYILCTKCKFIVYCCTVKTFIFVCRNNFVLQTHTIVLFFYSVVIDIAPNITTPTPYITVLNGSSVRLTCVQHEGAATIKWMFSGIIIKTSSKYTIADNSTQLNINIVNTSDAGIYYCQATNIAGSSTAAITIVIQGKIICICTCLYNALNAQTLS